MSRSDDQPAPTTSFARPGSGSLLLSALPLAAAIGVFGVIFGAASTSQMDPGLAMLMSALVFSGTLQFATLGLLATDAGAIAIVVTALALNMRHVVLGAVLRPHVDEPSLLRRALLSWFLIDESFGLALASKRRAGFVLVFGGAIFYLAWQVGTILGVLGAQAVSIEGLAAAVFPVLFIGLAAITVRNRSDVVRGVVAGLIVAALSFVPSAYPFAPIIAAVVVAVPAGLRR